MSKNYEKEIVEKTLESKVVKDLLSLVKEEDKKIILEALKEYSKLLSNEIIPNLNGTFGAIQKNPDILNKLETPQPQKTPQKTIKDV